MPNYDVKIFRPWIEAATPQEAAQKSMTEPLTANDEFLVTEKPPDASSHYIPGSSMALGGAFPMPQYKFTGPDFTPTVLPPVGEIQQKM